MDRINHTSIDNIIHKQIIQEMIFAFLFSFKDFVGAVGIEPDLGVFIRHLPPTRWTRSYI